MQRWKPFLQAAKTGGLFFCLTLWMAWVVVSRHKWLV
jgi:hypothetical protein